MTDGKTHQNQKKIQNNEMTAHYKAFGKDGPNTQQLVVIGSEVACTEIFFNTTTLLFQFIFTAAIMIGG